MNYCCPVPRRLNVKLFLKAADSNSVVHFLHRKRRDHSRGNAITEFVVTIPILIVLFSGLVFLGRKISMFGSVSQAAFNTALYASGMDSSASSQNKGIALARKLIASAVRSDALIENQLSLAYTDIDGDSRADLVTLSYDGSINGPSIGSYFGGPLDVQATLPILGSSNIAAVSPDFQNPSVRYCSDGVIRANCPTQVGSGSGCTKYPEYCGGPSSDQLPAGGAHD